MNRPANAPDQHQTTCVERALDLLNGLDKPPVLSSSTRALLASVQDPYVEIARLAGAIEQQPAIAARLIGLANSSLYNPDPAVASVQDAVVRILGLDLSRGVVLGFLLTSTFSSSACAAFNDRRFWREALTLARLSRDYALLAQASEEVVAFAYLAGLLHRVGLLVSAAIEPETCNNLLIEQSDVSLSDRLAARMGFHHRHSSQAIAALWSLPEAIRSSLVESPEPHTAGWYSQLAKTLLDHDLSDTEVVDEHRAQHAAILKCTAQDVRDAVQRAVQDGELPL